MLEHASNLTSLALELSRGDWMGRREREIVSLFCFGYLLGQCMPDGVLHHPAQIAIEVAVPQISSQTYLTEKTTTKAQVCKDIVIWPRPRMVSWDAEGKPTVAPLSIIEWKHNEGEISDYDLEWLWNSPCGRLILLGMRSAPIFPLGGLRCRVAGFLLANVRLNGFISNEAMWIKVAVFWQNGDS